MFKKITLLTLIFSASLIAPPHTQLTPEAQQAANKHLWTATDSLIWKEEDLPTILTAMQNALDEGAAINSQHPNTGQTALHLPTNDENIDFNPNQIKIIQFLIKHSADLFIADNGENGYQQLSPAPNLSYSSDRKNSPMSNLLCAYGFCETINSYIQQVTIRHHIFPWSRENGLVGPSPS
jgi:hypothetical protein